MKYPSILSDLRELWQIVAEKLIDSPKPAIFVSSYSFGVGLLGTMFDWFKDGLPFLSMLAGFLTAVITVRMTSRRNEREAIELETAKIKNRIAREELAQHGEMRAEDERIEIRHKEPR